MFLQVPITFSARLRESEGAPLSDETLGTWREVHVAEIPAADAPVATRWAAGPRGDLDAPGGVHETRWFEESHWEPVLFVSTRPAVPVTAEALAESCARGYSRANPLIDGPMWTAENFASGRLRALADVDPALLKGTSIRHSEAAADRAAENVVLVDGQLWKRRDEPVYALKGTSGIGAYEWCDVSGARTAKAPERVWRADRWDEMLEFTGRRMTNGDVFQGGNRIEVLVADSIRHDDRSPALVESLRGVEMLNVPYAMQGPAPRREAYEAFRDAVVAAAAKPSRANARRLAEAAEIHLVSGYDDPDHYGARRIAAALDRWTLTSPEAVFERRAERGPDYAPAP